MTKNEGAAKYYYSKTRLFFRDNPKKSNYWLAGMILGTAAILSLETILGLFAVRPLTVFLCLLIAVFIGIAMNWKLYKVIWYKRIAIAVICPVLYVAFMCFGVVLPSLQVHDHYTLIRLEAEQAEIDAREKVAQAEKAAKAKKEAERLAQIEAAKIPEQKAYEAEKKKLDALKDQVAGLEDTKGKLEEKIEELDGGYGKSYHLNTYIVKKLEDDTYLCMVDKNIIVIEDIYNNWTTTGWASIDAFKTNQTVKLSGTGDGFSRNAPLFIAANPLAMQVYAVSVNRAREDLADTNKQINELKERIRIQERTVYQKKVIFERCASY